MSSPTEIRTGDQKHLYGRRHLAVYDVLVHGLANRYSWHCPTSVLVRHYDRHVRADHLDVGPGTGQLLDRCTFPTPRPSLTLLDRKLEVLQFSADRLRRYRPTLHQADLLDPATLPQRMFSSIGLSYVLHCLPGTMAEKGDILARLASRLRPDGVLFGATVVNGGIGHPRSARLTAAALNRLGAFHNTHDDLAGLRAALARSFTDHEVETRGSVALFAAARPREEARQQPPAGGRR
jgi:SAM-dependent methyltransferase